jgi:hypothetical protein
VGRIDDRIGIACAGRRQALAEAPRQCRKLFPRAHQAANPIEELQEVGEAAELKQLITWPGQLHVVLVGQSNNVFDFETAFEVDVNFRLRQGHEPAAHIAS